MKTLFNLLFYILFILILSFISFHVTAKIILVEKDLLELDNSIESKETLDFVLEERILRLKKNTNEFIPNVSDRSHCPDYDYGFCTEVEDYPEQYIKMILRKEFKRYELILVNDESPIMKNNPRRKSDENFGEEKMCTSSERTIYPRAGLTKDSSWSYIINQQNYTQGIRIEECINPGGPCTMSESFPNGYTTECKQKYIYHQLMSINLEGRIIDESFRLPSVCECILKSAYRFLRGIRKEDNESFMRN